jgi:hypothetical protein
MFQPQLYILAIDVSAIVVYSGYREFTKYKTIAETLRSIARIYNYG